MRVLFDITGYAATIERQREKRQLYSDVVGMNAPLCYCRCREGASTLIECTLQALARPSR